MFSLLYLIIRLGLGALFLYSGMVKLLEPVSFATLIDAYGLIPEETTFYMALFLALLEIVAGSGLLFDIKGSLTTVCLLLILFMMILSYGIWMGLDIDCGCYGPEDPETSAFHGLREALYRDAFFLIGAFFLFYYRFQHSIHPKSIHLFLNPFHTRRSRK